MNWILQPYNTVFSIAFAIVVLFAILELLGLIFGFSLSDATGDGVDLAVPDAPELPDAEISVTDVPDGALAWQEWFRWIFPGGLPLLVSGCFFLGCFALSGFVIQATSIRVLEHPLHQALAALLAIAVSLPPTRIGNKLLRRIWPQDETYAVERAAFVGLSGTVTIGTATQEKAAEVKVGGPHGDNHYVMAFALNEPLSQGCAVILVRQHATIEGQYVAMLDTSGVRDFIH